ncbi:filamentous hemagglutinin N-terminal domain-containing protein [Nostoc sp. FACHB-892]|uniref:two-partner secretion domain-containing protein n=1 Tax=Nostoc sp. FACHB-892 TaxID=2692843 RepID=UPI001682B8EA|nr:filamentous hemagglutinin N-terminal domain-containing protein [Nostoc sp. FACHB-892]MBD2730603.1 filamentous hemagglutinin N-terminal domain-containing protein [Nostoc sp. FACHB-892]
MSGLGFACWGALAAITFGVSFCTVDYANAQITPDGTLPNNSSVTREGDTFNITGGTQAGGNLFHSFGEFSVNTGGTASFNNALDIQNIISRVTGGSVSNIDGIIRTLGTANLFLINPNGIVFGENASLNVGGSFVASTANALQFGNRGFFSATDKNIPSPLLTIDPSALLFNQINQNAAIQNNSVAPAGTDLAGLNALGLRVGDGKSLLLVGGNVNMDSGQLNAYGGRVELGGLAAPGNVNLLFNEDNLSLRFPENVTRASVSLTNQAGVHVKAAGGGNIAINARNVEILGGSSLDAGIAESLGAPETVAGNVTVSATNAVSLANANIFSTVEDGGVGKGGNIDISAATLSTDGAILSSSTYGQGNAGNITVGATNAVSLAGNTYILNTVGDGGVGKGGNIDISAATLSTDGAILSSSTYGQGNAGNITVGATNAVSLAGFVSILSTVGDGGVGNAGNITVGATNAVSLAGNTYIGSRVEDRGVGNGGNININAATLSTDGAILSSSTYGQGNAGNITVGATNAVSLADNTYIESTVGDGGVGNAGNITVGATNAVSLAGNTYIESRVGDGGVGKGGNININAATLSTDGAVLLASTYGQGNAGNITVGATNAVSLAGNTYIGSRVETGSVGNGGNIDINAATLSLTDGARLSSSTFGQGNAGNITVGATNAVSLANADIFSTVSAGGVGKGGNININAATLSLTDGAQLQTGARDASATQPAGIGNAGNVNVLITGNVDIAGRKNGSFSGIFSSMDTGTVGNGGSITINSGSFSLRDGAALSASIYGQGNAGNVNVLVTGAVNIAGQKNGNQSGILSVVGTGAVGNGGNITINSGSFSLRDDAGLSASIFGQGNAGNVTVGARNAVFIANNAGIFSTVEKGGVGKGGNIDINSPKITLDNQGLINAETASGNGGNININSDLLLLRHNSQITTEAGTEELGSDLLLRRNSQIITGAGTEELGSDLLLHRNSQFTINAGTKKLDGDGGNININSKFIVAVPNENSDIRANAFTGAGGRVNIKANGIYGIEFRKSPTLLSDITASSEFGTQGTVELNTPGIDPNSGLVALPTVAVDTQIAQGCFSPGYAQNSFIITGRGGLPPNPREAFSSNIVRPEWATLGPSNDINSQQTIKEKPPIPTSPAPIVEATGWGTNTKGEIVLTANASTGAPHKNWQQSPVTCSSAKSADN